jgi:hypothetical protein
LFLPASQKNFKFPVSRPDDRAIPSGRPSVHCSICPEDVSSRPYARQTSIIHPDEVFIPSGPHTVSRSLCASLHPSGRFSSTSGRLPVLDQFVISFQVPRKGRSISTPLKCLRRTRVNRVIMSRSLTSVANYQKDNQNVSKYNEANENQDASIGASSSSSLLDG